MKKSLSVLLCVCTLATTFCVFTLPTVADTSGDYTYSKYKTGVKITGYSLYGGDVTIPAYLDGKKVLAIESAFYEKKITSVAIPYGVEEIGEYTFYGCENLSSASIPDSVTSIGDGAFGGCSNLSSANIPDSVTNIGNRAFSDCSKITNLTIPDSVTSIGDGAFSYCTSLTSITIGNGVTSIGTWAFEGCKCLTSITIGNGVTSIGAEAFWYCTGLTNITIPESVTSIGASAFFGTAYYNASSNWVNNALYIDNCLLKVENTYAGVFTIKPGTRVIAAGAFNGCSELTGAEIPNSVISNLDLNTFYNCQKLAGSVAIPAGSTYIGNSVFYNCLNLASVTIPASVTEIKNQAFYNCTRMADVYYEGTKTQWNAISIGSDNEPLIYSNVHYNSPPPWTTEPTATETEPIATETEPTMVTQSQQIAHAISVSLGIASKATALAGEYITVTADVPAQGLEFDKWTGDGVIFENSTSAETRFVMPDNAVTISATYKVETYMVMVIGGTADKASAAPGSVVTVTANVPAGYVFDKWVGNGVFFLDNTATQTKFTMSANDVTVTATFKVIETTTTTKNTTTSTSTPITTQPSVPTTQLSATQSEPTSSTTQIETTTTQIETTTTQIEMTTQTEPTVTKQGILLGDATGDGNVNMKDVLVLRKFLAGMDVVYNAQNSDVTGDGTVNMKDVLMLRKYLAGIMETLGA